MLCLYRTKEQSTYVFPICCQHLGIPGRTEVKETKPPKVTLTNCVIQLRVGKYDVHESHSMVPLSLKNRGMPHASMYIAAIENKCDHQYTNFL